MGTRNQHQRKAQRNQKFVDAISGSGFPEWEAIAHFYTAVHLVEEMLATVKIHATSHRQRQDILKKNYPEILRPFRTLYNFALASRYQFQPVTASQLETIRVNLAQLQRLTTLEINEG